MTVPKVFSVKASAGEESLWVEAAQKGGVSIHAWMKSALTEAADRDLAASRRADSVRAQRELLTGVMRGSEFVLRPDPK